MTTLDDLQLHPPKLWDKFEILCCDLWQEIWNDPDAQRYGRLGQDQEGIDIIGTLKDHSHEALQCKKKDIIQNKKISETEVKNIDFFNWFYNLISSVKIQ